jgi:hypothetical protein
MKITYVFKTPTTKESVHTVVCSEESLAMLIEIILKDDEYRSIVKVESN